VPWPGLLFGIPILGFYYWCTNQNIVQCVLTARSVEHARWGTLFAGLLKLSVLFLVVLPGTCALLLFPHLPRADVVYANLILHLLPDGLVGLVVAAFIAATLVGTASLLNSASTLITLDVVRRFRPDLGDERSIRIGRIATACLMLFAVAWAPQLYRFSSLWQYLQGVLAYVVPPIVVVFLMGKFWKGANAQGAKVTLFLGSLCGLALFLLNGVFKVTHLHFLYVAPLLAVLDAMILLAVSLCYPAPLSESQTVAMGYRGQDSLAQSNSSWWKDHRIQGAFLIVLTAALVIAFR
jgi:SSS family solute:Na+ symporter